MLSVLIACQRTYIWSGVKSEFDGSRSWLAGEGTCFHGEDPSRAYTGGGIDLRDEKFI